MSEAEKDFLSSAGPSNLERILDDLLFAPLRRVESVTKEALLAEIQSVDPERWFFDPYRNCDLLALFTLHGHSDAERLSVPSSFEELAWTSIAIETCPQLIHFAENELFRSIGGRGRIVAIRTRGFSSTRPHVDSGPSFMSSRQHKWRWVLQGSTDTLYFIGGEGQMTPAPIYSGPFIMDGRWPHGMSNTSHIEKITLALGSPWRGCSNESYLNYLGNDSSDWLFRSSLKAHDDLSFFQKRS